MGSLRRAAAALSVATSLATVSLLPPTAALAAVAQFRYDHGEPLNNLRVTPGAIFNVMTTTICRSGYASSVRDVTESEKSRIYAAYGITHHTTDQYEIDHLISLELGGSNAIGNLWPELNDHPKGYLNSKDKLENRLHALVCKGKLGLQGAQRAIATDWVSAYHQYLGMWPIGLASLPAAKAAPSGAPTSTSTTRPPATTAHGSAVTITSLSNPVVPGDEASLTAHSAKPNDSCTLSVRLPSGAASESSGLGAATANASGTATWTWKIGARTGPGTAQASVNCGAGSASAIFTIT